MSKRSREVCKVNRKRKSKYVPYKISMEEAKEYKNKVNEIWY